MWWPIFPSSPVLCLFPQYSLLCQVVLDTIHPPSIQSLFPPLPWHINPHHSFTQISFPSHTPVHVRITLTSFPTVCGYFPTFVALLIIVFLNLSNFVNPNIHLDIFISAIIIQVLLLCFHHCLCQQFWRYTSLLVLLQSCILHRCQQYHFRVYTHAFLAPSRFPAFHLKCPAFLAYFKVEKNALYALFSASSGTQTTRQPASSARQS